MNINLVLTVIIVLLSVVTIVKLYNQSSACGTSALSINCKCGQRVCRCRGMQKSYVRQEGCSGLRSCTCGCQNRGGCESMIEMPHMANRESMSNGNKNICALVPNETVLASSGDTDLMAELLCSSVEQGVKDSHAEFCNALNLGGSSGPSRLGSVLGEDGSGLTTNFVGLTRRKLECALTNVAKSDDARQTPTEDFEFCCKNSDQFF